MRTMVPHTRIMQLLLPPLPSLSLLPLSLLPPLSLPPLLLSLPPLPLPLLPPLLLPTECCPQLPWHSMSKQSSVTSQTRWVTHSARPPQPTPVTSEFPNLHAIAFPCSTEVWKEPKGRRVKLFWEAVLLGSSQAQFLLHGNQSISKAPCER